MGVTRTGIENATLQFVPTAEGYYSFVENCYIYQYRDHLGNARVSYSRNSAGSIEVTDKNNYYPFGMNHLDNDSGSFFGQSSYKNYKYQGQELQETGWYSFKWRNYMPDVGRFFNVDPLSEKYAYQSHYNFSENRVIDSRELEGLEAVKVNKDVSHLVITVNGRAGGGSGDYIQGNNTLVKNLPAPYNRGDDGLSLIGKNPIFSVDNATVINYAGSDSNITSKHIAQTISDYHAANPDGQIDLVGHSLGGKNVLEAANIAKDVPINLVMTLEAASPEGGILGSAYSASLGSNVKNIINFNSNRSSYIGGGGSATNSSQKSTNISLPTGTDHTNMDNSLIFYIAPLLNTTNPVDTSNRVNFNNMKIFNNGQIVPDPNNKKGTSSY